MKTTTILFDLDGTLLPMDQDEFTKYYFGLLAKRLAPRGYEAKPLIDGIWGGTAAMVKNDGHASNETVFWERFAELLGRQVYDDRGEFEEFYRVDFRKAEVACGKNPAAAETVRMCRELGFRVALATNPIFPSYATESRISWAGMQPEEFELYTTYETSHFSKPNPKYYLEVLEKLNCSPEECLMVGNDTAEDMVAETLGMRVFLLTDCMINKQNADISRWPNGGFDALQTYIRSLLD